MPCQLPYLRSTETMIISDLWIAHRFVVVPQRQTKVEFQLGLSSGSKYQIIGKSITDSNLSNFLLIRFLATDAMYIT